ncbi:hypothetical protein A6769_37285 [Nostoc punctiforme NIES-2108]|uniref:Uncharacterized protein n=1 Tax=Nostoc punctiforme NIES-2108 TaxID=1356359 RepID=A0A367S2S7_NOSPU|nr:hypothetical protein A6769_37285 [Nostoc punctiforme NIES-2108]
MKLLNSVGSSLLSLSGLLLVGTTVISPVLAEGIRYPSNNGFGQVRDNREIVDACDTNENGKGFFVRYRLQNGTYGNVRDRNGAKAGCGIERVGSRQNPILRFTICQVGTGCSMWWNAR